MGLGEAAGIAALTLGYRVAEKGVNRLLYEYPIRSFRALFGDPDYESELASMLGKASNLARLIDATYDVFKYGRSSEKAFNVLESIRNDLQYEIVPAEEFEESDEDSTEGDDEESYEDSTEGDDEESDVEDSTEGDDEESDEDSTEEYVKEYDEECDDLRRDLDDVRELLDDPHCHVLVYRKLVGRAVKIVVAVRGTDLLCLSDLKEDFKLSFEHLHNSERLVKIEKLVRVLIKWYGCEAVCLTGHSLGAAIAFIVARQLYLDDKEVEGHFFALPFMPLDRIIEKIVSILEFELFVIRGLTSILGLDKSLEKFMGKLTEGSTNFVSGRLDLAEEAKLEFNRLTGWHPYIYVQKFDVISNGYVEFFRNTSSSAGLSRSIAFLHRLPGMDPKARHLCPSAILITGKAGLGTLTSHGINRWMNVEPCRFKGVQITDFCKVREFERL